MDTKIFELWLDESGRFENDQNLSRNPSLVGGVLVEKDKLNIKKISDILELDFVHSNEINSDEFGNFAIKVLTKTRENNGNMVIFENAERLEIVDSTTTYLNIISEGIIQLIQLLSAEHGQIELNVLVAVRLDMVRQDLVKGLIIKHEEYVSRLEERITIGLARRLLSTNSKWKWSIQLASARKDKRLMLADVVCNTWLTRSGPRRFTDKNREEISKLYLKKHRFTVFEKATSSYIKRLIAEGDLSGAIFEVYTSQEKILKADLVDIILRRLSLLGSEGMRLQLLNLKNKIGVLVKINKDFDKSKIILSKLQDDFIVGMKKLGLEPGIFALDIYLYMLTVFTHEGNIQQAEKQIILCEDAMKKLANRWESIDYFFMFKTRLAVHQVNCFDFYRASQEMTDIINSLKETMGLFSIIDGLGELYDNLKSDILGKALGTRLQSNTMILRKENDLYELIIEDSIAALKEFSRSGDIQRQYQYRSQVEYEAGNYTQALKYLFKVNNMKFNKVSDIDMFIFQISKEHPSTQSFCMMHYTKIMAEATIDKEMELSELLYEALVKNTELYNNITRNDIMDHPYEIIVWKLATYQGLRGNISSAIRLYDQAIGGCFKKPDRWTILAIGLGILAEKSSMLLLNAQKQSKEAEKSFKEFTSRYDDFMKLDLPKPMRTYFSWWQEEITRIKNSEDLKLKQSSLWKLSREIPY